MSERERPFRILVLGGYGHFGGRICSRLANYPQVQLLVGGRHQSSADKFVENLKISAGNFVPESVVIDHSSPCLTHELERLNLNLVIHASGPYQPQNHRVAESCISAGCHYIDLADARDFVVELQRLNDRARARGVSLISGASTVPGVSSAVVQSLKPSFERIDTIKICISPGNQTPRGLATLESVLSYCGKPFRWLDEGEWKTVYGWQYLTRHNFPNLGRRWLGACDVPDLELFPDENPHLRTVHFYAALELSIWQWGLWMLSWLSRMGLVHNWSGLADFFKRISDRFNYFGSPNGGMFVDLEGFDQDGKRKRRTWYLTALNGHGPEIPIVPAVILARKLAEGENMPAGAYSALNAITLEEFSRETRHLDLSWEVIERSRPDG